MYEITLGESSAQRLPALDFRGTPTGIDVRLVVQPGILPQIDTGMAHREPGVGQVGAGLVKPPRPVLGSRVPEAPCRPARPPPARPPAPEPMTTRSIGARIPRNERIRGCSRSRLLSSTT
jgi:hypothetical protein